MTMFLRKPLHLLPGLAVGLTVSIASPNLAFATIGDDGLIHACIQAGGPKKPNTRIIDKTRTCRPAEVTATWSITGPKGDTGATGPAGVAGINGTNGVDGATGATGPAGAAGINGTNGVDGATGATGPAGANGTNGTNGTNGAIGPAGPTLFKRDKLPAKDLAADAGNVLPLGSIVFTPPNDGTALLRARGQCELTGGATANHVLISVGTGLTIFSPVIEDWGVIKVPIGPAVTTNLGWSAESVINVTAGVTVTAYVIATHGGAGAQPLAKCNGTIHVEVFTGTLP